MLLLYDKTNLYLLGPHFIVLALENILNKNMCYKEVRVIARFGLGCATLLSVL